MKVGVIIPSIRPESYFNLAKTFCFMPSHFHPILIAQYPWTIEQMLSAPAEYCAFAKRKEIPSMASLRSLAYDLNDEYDYYLIFDDDLELTNNSFVFLNMCLHNIEKYNLGSLSMVNNHGPDGLTINPDKCIITTSRGIFIKNIGQIATQEERSLLGGCEEPIFVYRVMSYGYKHGIISKAPINRNIKGVKLKKNHESKIHDIHVYNDNVRRYIRDRYSDDSWEVLTGKYPRGLINT